MARSPWASGTRLHGWRHPAVLSAAALSIASGFAQFGVSAVLADVAAAFGEPTGGQSIAAQAGLSASIIGFGTAMIRLASLGSLPLSGLADHWGRRRVMILCSATGLALTATAALSPSYWWFVIIIALGRPALSTTNALAGVIAAEETRSVDRAKAIGLVAASYAVGAGIAVVVRALGGDALGFRGLFALALLPLAALPLVGRTLTEPDRFATYQRTARAGAPQRLGSVRSELRPRLLLLAGLTLTFAAITGPANTFLFFYGEGVLEISSVGMAAVVVAAGPVGFLGLVAGRWAADALGRRVTAGTTHAVAAGAFALAYSGTSGALLAGYLLGVVCQGSYGIAMGALSAEVFPTSTRATAAGWLTAATVVGGVAGLAAFGVLSDRLGASFFAAATALAVPMAATAALFTLLPETRGLELEESAPDS